MNTRSLIIALLLPLLPLGAAALGKGDVKLHGSIQSDMLFPQKDKAIGIDTVTDKFLTNTYADLSLSSTYVDAGVRFEYLDHPLPGFEQGFKGWGVPNFYAKGRYKGFELTGGDFYEQFGAGFILRTYEERSLGIDNSIRGGRLKYSGLKGLRLTALGGVQRRYWSWSARSQVYGADAELDLQSFCRRLADKDISWSVGASYVLKYEKDEDIIVPGTNLKLNLPTKVSAVDFRTHFYRNSLDLNAEFALKAPDPSFDNNYTYRHGTALMLSGSYSKPGWSALLQVKRSENMAFRSRRSVNGMSAFINHMPPFAYQHTYALAAIYPYATQAAPGEWAFQGNFNYTFKRRTALGGKYGTKLRLNVSYIRGINRENPELVNGSEYGTDGGKTKFFGFGDLYYEDINLQMEKRITRDFSFNAMYMFQRYNQNVVEGHGDGIINSNIFVVEGKYKFSKKVTLRAELQYLTTKKDKGDWAYGLVEVSVLPYLMFSASDMWNTGVTNNHYYMFAVTGNYKANRLMVGYGRTREGYNCTGGVCRYVPATRGFQISYSYNF